MKEEEEKIQWHPAFYEAIQAELVEYRDVLYFESEHQLTTEPLRIDVLIIRKRPDALIRKNIAAIFRTININMLPRCHASTDFGKRPSP